MARSLRVAVVARAVMPLHGIGGLERSVHDLVRHLAARDVAVTLITPPPRADAPRVVPAFSSPRVVVRHVPYVTFPGANRRGTTILDRSTAYPLFGLRAGRAALVLARGGAIDIVHGFGASVLGYALARRQATAPLVFNPQGLEEFGATGSPPWPKRVGYAPLRRAVRVCARAADAIIATDASLVPAMSRHLHPRPGQVHVIPNGIDLAAADRLAAVADGGRIRKQHGLTPEETLILSVGRLEFNKGFDVLAAALGRANQPGGSLANTSWRWVLVGTGPFSREIEAAAVAHGIAARTLFAGRATEADVHAWYEAATLFVHPTRYEGSSLVTLEAMAHRRAIVATRAGGLPDKVRPGVNGWLVEPGDSAALAAALTDALSGRERIAQMGQRSREIVEREFAWPVLVEQQLALYESLLKSAVRP